jgi:hypothetical protein
MQDEKLLLVNGTLLSLPRGVRRGQRREGPTRDLGRRDLRRRPGRAWINGYEVGGADERLAHLADSHD